MPVPIKPPTLSVIVPTQGRDTLFRLMRSLAAQELIEADEFLIVVDGHELTDDRWQYINKCGLWLAHQAMPLGKRIRVLKHDVGFHAWGHPQVNYGMQEATGDYLTFIDDDDVYVTGAFETIRRVASAQDEPGPMMFRFVAPWREVLWSRRALIRGRIGGHNLVVPNVKEKLGLWPDEYEGDFDFIVDTLERWKPQGVQWCTELIAVTRPGSAGANYDDPIR